ncbi:MAG: hypothetical protein WC553_02340 [Patescibacteria group bacterium]
MDSHDLDGLIDDLDSTMNSLFADSRKNWRSIWDKIREIGASFKGIRYPTPEDRIRAWDRFQSLVEQIKNAQDDDRRQWEQKCRTSASHKDRILGCIYSPNALSGGIADLVVSADNNELSTASSALKGGWNLLSSCKDEMLGRDKQEAFRALSNAQALLNQAWDHYRSAKRSAHEAQQRAWEEKQRAWQQRVQDNIDKLETRIDKLNEMKNRKESHISQLQSDISCGGSDNYVERVEGWIDEEEGRLQDINEQISQVEGWLSEARDKLR